jgi:hypothetical protein
MPEFIFGIAFLFPNGPLVSAACLGFLIRILCLSDAIGNAEAREHGFPSLGWETSFELLALHWMQLWPMERLPVQCRQRVEPDCVNWWPKA